MKSMYEEHLEKQLGLQPTFRASDLQAWGIPRYMLKKFIEEGKIEKLARGLYRNIAYGDLRHESNLIVARKSPQAVLALISALDFHGIGTHLPREIWIALPRNRHAPRMSYPQIRPYQFSEKSYGAGIEEHLIDGVTVKVYSPAKTVADVFARRNQVGIDVCVEALRDVVETRKATISEIAKYARINRVEGVMAPYIEMMIAK